MHGNDVQYAGAWVGSASWAWWPTTARLTPTATAATARPSASNSTATATAKQHAKPKRYNPRHPEHTLLYRTVAQHFETWLELASAGQFDGQGDHHTPRACVRQAFRKYLECGIFAHGLARARCADCGHDFFVAFSCNGRGVCPSCNTRHMVETTAHLAEHVLQRIKDVYRVLITISRYSLGRTMAPSPARLNCCTSRIRSAASASSRVAPTALKAFCTGP